MFLSEDKFEVVRIDYGIANIPLFRINVLQSSESIQFGTEITRMEPNNKIELKKVLGLLCLFPDQHLGSRKILKVFMIRNNIDRIG